MWLQKNSNKVPVASLEYLRDKICENCKERFGTHLCFGSMYRMTGLLGPASLALCTIEEVDYLRYLGYSQDTNYSDFDYSKFPEVMRIKDLVSLQDLSLNEIAKIMETM